MRRALLLAGLVGLTACSGAFAPETRSPTAQPTAERTTAGQQAAAPSTRATPAPPAAPVRPPLRLSDLMGRAPGEIDLRLGAPDLVRTEGNGQVRIYSNPDCILHIFAYPGGTASRVTHVEARTRIGRLAGDAFNNCLESFRRS
ncbi:MAG: hypothetical protein ACPGQ5_11125 [Alphaproteobacteria bacterium]